MGIRIIITGTTGMVGEGVLLECLQSPQVAAVLSVSRRPAGKTHPKLKEYLVPDFRELQMDDEMLKGYDACFFCAGISSIGIKEDQYRTITYDTTMHFARVMLRQNPQITFIYVSGRGTDSSEKGRSMWARVKGKTENGLLAAGFSNAFMFRPAFMKAVPGQQFTLRAYRYLSWLYPVLKAIAPDSVSTLQQVGRAMINAVTKGSLQQVLEVKDINALSER
ncbi:epimerase [Niabella ginsenosidivorans]|uniref:Epimerase n=1 Tax=Niabella ginsenosidivorans TaxID=1176587 RepID=A0A1A9HYQ6_9BACT|nr:epimerase [Niabella ginsenosidivorans]ANH80538.1 epimerase [Niabella ginsenosidivorans]